jgi:hypothetical protein
MIIYADRKHKLSKEEALRDRLLARLELSKEYKLKAERMQESLGLDQLNHKIENRLLPRITDIERRIFSTPAATQSDLNIKNPALRIRRAAG